MLHDARRRSFAGVYFFVGIILTALGIGFDVHCINPSRACFPFTKDITWTYSSPLVIDVCFYFLCIFTFYYYRVILTKYRIEALRMMKVALIIVTISAICAVLIGETNGGKKFIEEYLRGTVFVDILLPDYYAIVFSAFVGTTCGIMIGVVFGVLGIRNIPVQGVITCTLFGGMTGITTFITLVIHTHMLTTAVVYGLLLFILNVAVNAMGITCIGAPIVMLQKIISSVRDSDEKKESARRKRMKAT